MKRVISILLTALMVFTMAVTAFGFDFTFIDNSTLTGDEDFNSSMVYDREVEHLFAANGTPPLTVLLTIHGQTPPPFAIIPLWRKSECPKTW